MVGELIVIILLNAFAIVTIKFRKKFAKENVEVQNKTFGFKFGEKEIKGGERWYIIFGIFVAIFDVYVFVKWISNNF